MLSAGMGSPGIHEIIQKSLLRLQYEEYNLPFDIVRRGVGEIPNYHFRDDALELWYAIMVYVKRVVDFFYSSDEDIIGDLELQDWIKEMYR